MGSNERRDHDEFSSEPAKGARTVPAAIHYVVCFVTPSPGTSADGPGEGANANKRQLCEITHLSLYNPKKNAALIFEPNSR